MQAKKNETWVTFLFLLIHGVQMCFRQLRRILNRRGLSRRVHGEGISDTIEYELEGSGCV